MSPIILLRVLAAGLVASLIANAGLGFWTWKRGVDLESARKDVQIEEGRHAATREAYEREAAQAHARYRTIEQELAKARQAHEEARLQERRHAEAVAADLRRERDRLRVEIEQYAANRAGDGESAVAALAACRERATALGQLLGGYLQADVDSAKQLKALAADIRSLLAYIASVERAMSAARDR